MFSELAPHYEEDEAWSIAEADLAEVNAAPKQAPKPKNKMKKKEAPAPAKPAAPPDPIKVRRLQQGRPRLESAWFFKIFQPKMKSDFAFSPSIWNPPLFF